MDIKIINEGSVFLFEVCSPAGREWVAENVQLEGWQWLGGSAFAVDHRYAAGLADAMMNAGLSVV